ncbi:tannase/feruloyl esterase family alpha/beta hydrolase [Variovorax guangxiensis]|uniref:Tannase/feruloyl esterase family alpha/beta hydrolase n=1 Tax=Variovorax guangxiensis TaxID=1775474 RepID=A0A3S0ZLP8_9BURK|nr:tannase/feruloyl esterase family alpha/beta hydrolase [Variovorax guangxiensis]RUR66629.1 tannase/feruloyl esterase family alpha/beta hydrolase [Variovorax guangxiensis]
MPKPLPTPPIPISAVLCLSFAAAAVLTACGGSSSSGPAVLPLVPAPATAPPAGAPLALACDESLKTAFRPDADTTVTVVKQFRKGDDLNLDGKASGTVAASDVCMVKLNVGPGHAGPADAPSTSPGIGIEVWLPSQASWNSRIRVLGGGGFVGDAGIGAKTQIGGANAAAIAAGEGSVSAVTDAGHASKAPLPSVDGSFAMNPDGTVNTTLWTDFASRGIHQMAVKAKALAAGFYQRDAKYAYWDGCSTGGRQGHMQAQVNPDDFDGILAGNSAINWTSFITAELYPQVVMQRDLGGTPLTADQLSLVSSSAVSACDSALTGQHDGFISDPAACNYDPAQDKTVLCTASGGTNATAACLSTAQAQAVNKIWYGQTRDGSAPAPASDIGYGATLASNQLWYGLTRGTALNSPGAPGFSLADSVAGVPMPFHIAAHQVALNLQDPTIATPDFINATGNGADKWKGLSYAQLANASDRGKALQTAFANINADNPDLARFRDRGAKLLTYHGLADQLIPSSGTANYYERAAKAMGGIDALQKFYRYVEIPAMGHCAGVGSVNGLAGTSPTANPPLPAQNQLFTALTDWVEKGIAPDSMVMQNADKSLARPLCTYPKKIAYLGGDVSKAESFACR